jgi:hypothetical protein
VSRLRFIAGNEVRWVRRAAKNPKLVPKRLKRVSLELAFVDTNHDTDKALFISGTGRSGSTWLTEVLVDAFSARVIFEPLRRDRVRLSAAIPWGFYVDPDDPAPDTRHVLARILSGRIRSPWTDKHNIKRLRYERRLVKEIRSNNLLPWMTRAFPEVPFIYLLRHPFATAWSATKLGWSPYFGEFLKQTELMDGPLAPYRDLIDANVGEKNLFHRHILRWCIENLVPSTMTPAGSAHVIFYEDLLEDPGGELKRLASHLDTYSDGYWSFDPETLRPRKRPSRTNYRQTPKLTPDERVNSWLGTVPPEDVAKALPLLEAFGLDRIYGNSVRPLLRADQLLT